MKKLVRHGYNLCRYPIRPLVPHQAYLERPPVLLNSIPKSGTHMMLKALEVIPDLVDRGSFLASRPSLTYREVPNHVMGNKVHRILPGELVAGHIHHSPLIARNLEINNCIVVFIYRDPRDVVISESHYLATMNRWHRLHKAFSSLPDDHSRYDLAINGFETNTNGLEYKNILERYQAFLPWLNQPGVIPVRYEDCLSDKIEMIIKTIFTHYQERSTACMFNIDKLLDEACSGIRNKNTATFREGASGKWRSVLSAEQKDRINTLMSKELAEMGYDLE
jgi:hypothetical protein